MLRFLTRDYVRQFLIGFTVVAVPMVAFGHVL